jgi:hypothetical protein
MQIITVTSIKAPRKQTNCYCNAYSFPHRAGSCKDKARPVERNCAECHFSKWITDYNGTGDRWNAQFECDAKGIRPCEQ